MPTTLHELTVFLENNRLKYQLMDDGESILTGFVTQSYRTEEGDPHIHVVLTLEENGEFLRIYAPSCYPIPQDEKQAIFFKALFMVSSRSKLVQFIFPDEMDEMIAKVEIPIEDSQLTEAQFLRALFELIRILEFYHPVIQRVLDTGLVEFEESDGTEVIMDLVQEMMDKAGIQSEAEGLDELSSEESNGPDEDSSSDDFDDFI